MTTEMPHTEKLARRILMLGWSRMVEPLPQIVGEAIRLIEEDRAQATAALRSALAEAERRAEEATRERDAWHKDAVYRVNAENDRRAALRRAEDAEARVSTLTDALREVSSEGKRIAGSRTCDASALAAIADRALAAAPSGAAAPREVHFFDKRAADTLANEVAKLIERRVIDNRSPAADALLDYRDGWDRNALSKQVPPTPAAGDARGEATTISNEESDHG